LQKTLKITPLKSLKINHFKGMSSKHQSIKASRHFDAKKEGVYAYNSLPYRGFSHTQHLKFLR